MARTASLIIGTFLLIATSTTGNALAGFVVSGKPKVSFYAKGTPGALDIEGKTNALTLTDDGATVTCVVTLSTLSTGIEMRDDHMKEHFIEVRTYPDATLSFARADLKLPTEVGASEQGTLTAQFTVHGVPLPATVTYTLKRSKTGYAVDATFAYNASDHKIAIPSYLGITVDPSQSARVRFDMLDQ